jgi:glycosyltransferase involved in cell wall biosynthesis
MDTSPLFDMHVFNENPTFKDEFDLLSEDERRKVFIPPGNMYVVSPSSGLENTARERNIDVFFSGRVGSYRSYRKDTLMYLIENGVSGYINFFLSETNLDNEEYYKLLSMSKIAINFSYSNEGHQLKGRALEAISVGAMLLESENPQISCFFEDGTDYVSFSSKEDLLEKIGYYLKNSEERVRIAKNGMRKVAELYHPHNYWEKIFEKIGIDLK